MQTSHQSLSENRSKSSQYISSSEWKNNNENVILLLLFFLSKGPSVDNYTNFLHSQQNHKIRYELQQYT